MHSTSARFISQLRECLSLPDQMGSQAQAIASQVDGLLGELDLRPHYKMRACPVQHLFADLSPLKTGLPAHWQVMAESLLELLPQLPWYQRQEPAFKSFMAGHANAQIVGPDGLIESDRLMLGISLLSPNITYPDHQHPPAEIYLVLTPGEWRQDDKAWYEPGPGSYVYNQPDVVHAMRSGGTPLLAIWCLPLV